MSVAKVVNPVYRVCLAMDARVGSEAANRLKAATIRLGPAGTPKVVHAVHERKGSSVQPPFVALEIGFALPEYDPSLVEQGLAALFADLQRNIESLRPLTTSEVTTRLLVNINSKSTEHRPILLLTRKQVALLADLGSTFELDGYLMI
jgi:hypothetical protein